MKHGRVVLERFESTALAGNAAGDPTERTVPVYLPPSYDTEPARRYPVIFVLAGFSGRGRGLLNDDPWSPPLDERMDALIAAGCGEPILVMPDAFTRFGGSQYLDSTATGRYGTHVAGELVAWVDDRYRTQPGRDHRGVVGRSSGGYGALVFGMTRPDVFGAVACHSGDLCFDYCYRGDVPRSCAQLQQAGGPAAWLERFEGRRQKSGDDMLTLNVLGMAAAYSPNPAAPPFGIDLPCDLESGAFREDVWRRWLAHDPLVMLEAHADALRSLRLLYLDCGTRDEFNLQLGARLFTRRLSELGVPHEYEEFDDGHRHVAYRYDASLPRLARALGATASARA
jgi:S-formylglutathione hydrolase FrmB